MKVKNIDTARGSLVYKNGNPKGEVVFVPNPDGKFLFATQYLPRS